MQVASTLWPDIKSQKISKRRFRLNWTKCSPRTTPKPVKTRQAPAFRQEEAQDSSLEEDGGGWWPGKVDRSTWSAELARGPHRLNFDTCHLLTVAQVGSASSHPWLLAINTRGVRDYDTHTHTHTTLPLLSCTSCIVFRLSGV